MTRHLDPPRVDQQIGRTKRRVHDLERRLARPQPDVPAHVSKFSQHGPVVATRSGPDSHPSGGRLVLAWAKLDTAGGSDTVVDLLRNGVIFDTLRLPTGVIHAELVVAQQFNARIDTFQVEVTEPGAGARSLTVFGQFDR